MKKIAVVLLVLCIPIGAVAEGRYVEVDDVRLFVSIEGEGEPLLLLHGGLGSHESMAPQAEVLVEHYRVIAPDSRGHGSSTGAGGVIDYRTMTADMIALLDTLDIAGAHVVGWSDGGIIGFILAAEHPERVLSLVAIGANISSAGMTDGSIEFVSGWTVEAAGEEMVSAYRQRAAEPDLWPVFFDTVRRMWLEAPIIEEAQLADIVAPTLLLLGDRDAIRPDHTRMIFDGIADSQLCIVPGASHFVPTEKPGLVNRTILDFLAGVGVEESEEAVE